MIQNKEITHSEFEKSCKLFGYETFSDKQMEAYIQDAKSLLEKSEKEELNDIEKSQLDEFNVNCASLKQINVVNDDLTKSLIYFRPAQVIWDKDENGEIMKSRAGTYVDTPENRKLGRVGQKFGGQKQGEEKKGVELRDKHEKYLISLLKKYDEAKDKNQHIDSLDDTTKAYLKNALEKRGEVKKEGGEQKEGKSTEASKVLQLMDKDSSYKEAVDKVVKETGVDRVKLEKELDKYI